MGPNCTSATATFLPPPSSGSARLAPRAPGAAGVFWPVRRHGPPGGGGGGGGAAGPGASSASLPPGPAARLSEMWMLGAQPMPAAARPTRWRAAAIRSANGPPGASGPPRAPCHRRLGGRRRARVSRPEARPPLLSPCGRGGGGGAEGALGRAARRGRPSEHALPEAGAAGRLPHIAALARPRRASGELRGGDCALRAPEPATPRRASDPGRRAPRRGRRLRRPTPSRAANRCRRPERGGGEASRTLSPPRGGAEGGPSGDSVRPRQPGRERGPGLPPGLGPRRREARRQRQRSSAGAAQLRLRVPRRVLRAARRAQPPAVTSSGCWRQCKAAGRPPPPPRSMRGRDGRGAQPGTPRRKGTCPRARGRLRREGSPSGLGPPQPRAPGSNPGSVT